MKSKIQRTKRANQNGGRVGKTTMVAASPKKTTQSVPRTPDREVNTHTSYSTPSTISSKSTSSSKRAISMMDGLELKSPSKKTKKIQDAKSANKFEDAATINWLSMKEVCKALLYYGKDRSKLKEIEYYDKILLLCNYFKPNDIHLVFQGILLDAGRNYQNLQLTKLGTMKPLSVEFAKACVDIYNAKLDFTVPGKITVKKENLGCPVNA